jgi:hypothetical protein
MNLKEYYKELDNIKGNYLGDSHLYEIIGRLRDSENFAFARFNDGEMMGIDKVGAVAARGDQKVDKSLHDALKKSLQHVQDNYVVGVPCELCFPKYNELAMSLVKQPQELIINAVALTNRNWITFLFQFQQAVVGKKILWISGGDQKIDFLRKEIGLNIVGHLRFPRKNTWEHYEEIKRKFKMLDENTYDIVMISLGPTARVFAQEMFEENPNKTFIDIGSTYDPFTRDVWHNCHKGWVETGFNHTKECKICN